jgi:uracil-DNA glycosylase
MKTKDALAVGGNNHILSESCITNWKSALYIERTQTYFQDILSFIEAERAAGKQIYPSNEDMFSCFKLTEFSATKVVIIGQDPYHGPGQAHGLSFSVPKGTVLPPSLRNIILELQADLHLPCPDHGCLQSWAEQGVLLLNAVLSVERSKPGSHAGIGWEQFTDAVIQKLNEHQQQLVFILWGAYAQKKEVLIDVSKHHILRSPHPSPFSAHRGFFGSRPFSRTNDYLRSVGKATVDWQLR